MVMQKGLALGVFDLFHIGHLRYLQYARKQVDFLAVAVISDHVCQQQKSKMPVIPQQERLEIVNGLKCVNEALLMQTSSEFEPEKTAEWIASLHVSTVIVGGCWQDTDRWNRIAKLLRAKQIQVVYAPVTQGISSTTLISYLKNRL